MKLKGLVILSIFFLPPPAYAAYLCPDGSYVSEGPCTLCPDGSYLGGDASCELAPDGSYVPASKWNNKNRDERTGESRFGRLGRLSGQQSTGYQIFSGLDRASKNITSGRLQRERYQRERELYDLEIRRRTLELKKLEKEMGQS